MNNDGLHPMVEKCAIKLLLAWHYAIAVDFFHNAGGHEKGPTVSWKGPGVVRQLLPSSALRCNMPDAGTVSAA